MSTPGEIVHDIALFLRSSWKSLNAIIEDIGWTPEILSNSVDQPVASCPVDPGHTVPTKSLQRHHTACSLISAGYTKQEIKAPSSKFFYEKTGEIQTVQLTPSLQDDILRQARVAGELPAPSALCTAAQDRVLYDYVVAQERARNPNWHKFDAQHLALPDSASANSRASGSDKPKSTLEILQELRDYKRRRQTYRAKNVHITKKSYTEVMREVIENQMAFIQEKDAASGKQSDSSCRRSDDEGTCHDEHRGKSQSRSAYCKSSPKRKRSSSADSRRERHGSSHHKKSRK